MAALFRYSVENGLQVQAADGQDLTEQQALIIAIRDLARSMADFAAAVEDASTPVRQASREDAPAQRI